MKTINKIINIILLILIGTILYGITFVIVNKDQLVSATILLLVALFAITVNLKYNNL